MPVEKAKYPVKMMARLLVRIDFSISMLTGTMRPIEKIILKVSIAFQKQLRAKLFTLLI